MADASDANFRGKRGTIQFTPSGIGQKTQIKNVSEEK
jgi:hypothetical protein